MIIYIDVILKHLFIKGKDFLWERPVCKCGNEKPWGHGYVSAYFDGFEGIFWLKRYRCPICGILIKLKPKGYLNRFQADIHTIRSCIHHKYYFGKWSTGMSRSRQNHWYQALIRKTKAYFGDLEKNFVCAFDRLLCQEIIPMSRSI